jgi:hypothetical protein
MPLDRADGKYLCSLTWRKGCCEISNDQRYPNSRIYRNILQNLFWIQKELKWPRLQFLSIIFQVGINSCLICLEFAYQRTVNELDSSLS